MARKKDTPCAGCGELIWRPAKGQPAAGAMCRECRYSRAHHEVVGSIRGRNWHRSRSEPPCDECRDAWNAYCREVQKRARDRGWRRPPTSSTTYAKVCEHCRAEFQTTENRSRFCSRRCFGLSRRGNSCTALVHVGPKVIEAPPTPVNVVTTRGAWAAITQGPCNWCGEQFTSTGYRARYCSRRCGAKAHSAKSGRRFVVQPDFRRAIYERDDWLCQICMEPVDPYADPLSDWFPSLDHIVPQSRTLIPDHSPSNLRTAHRWCNAVRGDGTYYTDDDLRVAS